MNQVIDEGNEHKFFTVIPNIVFDLGLKPLELTLYAHLKRAAGSKKDGKCTKSTATLVRETGLGAGTISRAKTALEKKRPELNKKSLIKTQHVPNSKGGKPNQEITITDIWPENMKRFATSREEIATSTREIEVEEQLPVELEPTSKPISSVEIKKNSKKNQIEEEQFTRYARKKDAIRCISTLTKARNAGINILPWIESVENVTFRNVLLTWQSQAA